MLEFTFKEINTHTRNWPNTLLCTYSWVTDRPLICSNTLRKRCCLWVSCVGRASRWLRHRRIKAILDEKVIHELLQSIWKRCLVLRLVSTYHLCGIYSHQCKTSCDVDHRCPQGYLKGCECGVRRQDNVEHVSWRHLLSVNLILYSMWHPLDSIEAGSFAMTPNEDSANVVLITLWSSPATIRWLLTNMYW